MEAGTSNRMVRVGLCEKMAFEQRLDKGEGDWRFPWRFPWEESSVLSEVFKDSKETSEARAELARR